jgi:hypothetical protein
MIYVTHDQVEAMSMADKIVVLRAGRIEQVGTPQMLYNQPANTFVAGFIGSPRMNFIPIASWPEPASAMTATTAAATAAATAASTEEPTQEPTQEPTPAWPPGTHRVGVRPEHWARASTSAAWAVTVQSVEYLGGQQLVQGHLPCQTRIEVLWEGSPPVQVGDRLALQVKPGQAHAFDAQGQRLGGVVA